MDVPAVTQRDRITELRVDGMRTLSRFKLRLNGFNVVIGPNGSGKSTLAEACVLLKKLAKDTFIQEFIETHRGFPSMLRSDARSLKLGLRLEGAGDPLEYEIELMNEAGLPVIGREVLLLDNGRDPAPFTVFQRQGNKATIFDYHARASQLIEVPVGRPLLSGFGVLPPQPAIPRLLTALQDIDVQLPFATTAGWAARSLRSIPYLRQSSLIEPVDRLHLGGSNLANAYQALKNEKSAEHWRTTMDYVRLGLGEDVESINLRADPGGGQIALMLKRKGVDQPEPAASLSDGMLGYLAFVAMLRLEAPTSLLMFDEPEVHLHPRLIQRVVGFFEAMSERTNVVICTHSDRLLDVLSNPAEAAVLLDLNAARETTLTRPNPEQLATWLESYNGLGALRSAGLEQVVFDEAES